MSRPRSRANPVAARQPARADRQTRGMTDLDTLARDALFGAGVRAGRSETGCWRAVAVDRCGNAAAVLLLRLAAAGKGSADLRVFQSLDADPDVTFEHAEERPWRALPTEVSGRCTSRRPARDVLSRSPTRAECSSCCGTTVQYASSQSFTTAARWSRSTTLRHRYLVVRARPPQSLPQAPPAGAVISDEHGAHGRKRAGLENRCSGNPATEGSNPSPSAQHSDSQQTSGFPPS